MGCNNIFLQDIPASSTKFPPIFSLCHFSFLLCHFDGLVQERHNSVANASILGLATEAWVNVASTAAGATCEEGSHNWYGSWPYNCERVIDGFVTPDYSWIANGGDAAAWIKVRLFVWWLVKVWGGFSFGSNCGRPSMGGRGKQMEQSS